LRPKDVGGVWGGGAGIVIFDGQVLDLPSQVGQPRRALP
jgi:hypothetical protein